MKNLTTSLVITAFALGAFAFPTGCTPPPRSSTPPPESFSETVFRANLGDAAAQKRLAARYATGNEVVQDGVLAEQWYLRADPNLSAKGGGNALEAQQRKRAEETRKTETKPDSAGKAEPAAKKPASANVPARKASAGVPAKPSARAQKSAPASQKNAPSAAKEPEVSDSEFQMLLRRASQGDPASLKKFREDPELRARFYAYAQTPEGKRNPFVDSVRRKLGR